MAETTKVIILKGNRKNPESTEHIIKFPGGSVSVCRTSNDEYWAHIEVNKTGIIEEAVRESAIGTIIMGRLDYSNLPKVKDIANLSNLEHIAVRIVTSSK